MAWGTRIFSFITLLTVSLATIACGNLLTAPQNAVAKVGDRVEFECSTNETTTSSEFSSDAADQVIPPDWKFFSATSSTKQFIYRSGYISRNLSSKYAIDNSTKGRYNLILNSVDLSFAGIYMCSEQFLGDKKVQMNSAELIVIDTDPVCSFNTSTTTADGDYICMWCTVSYRGHWIPTMEWTRNDDKNVHDDIRSNTSTAVTSMIITQLSSNDNGVTFMCKTRFKPVATNISMPTMQQGEVLARNVPHYQHLWNYTTTVSLNVESPDIDLVEIIGISAGAVILFVVIVTITCKWYKRGRMKPDVVPRTEQNNLDPSDHSESEQKHPVYAEVQRRSTGFQVAKNYPLPVYASVIKDRIEMKINGPSGQIPLPNKTNPKQNYRGADGTQYMDLESLTELKSNRVPVRQPPMFSLVETYATIDHTMAAPPPPLLSLPRRQ